MCDDCGEQCKRKDKLREHGYVHKEGGNFTCPHCQKTFTEHPNIRKHIGPIHEEKMISRTVCSKSFTGRVQLRTHVGRHSEATDFMCDDCGEQCKREDKLREHGKRMHNMPSKKGRPVVGQGIPGGQDLKGQPPNRHLEVLNQWNIPGRSCRAAVCPAFLLCLSLTLHEMGGVQEPQDGGHRTAGHGLQWQGRGPSPEQHR